MSVWSNLEGDLALHKSEHFSIKQAFLDIYDDEVTFSVEKTESSDFVADVGYASYRVVISINEGGERAEKIFKAFMSILREKKTARFDFQTTIRWEH